MNNLKRSVLWTRETLLADLDQPAPPVTELIPPIERVDFVPGTIGRGDLFVPRGIPLVKLVDAPPLDLPEVIAQALFRGASMALTDIDIPEFAGDPRVVRVPDRFAAFLHLAAIGRARLQGHLISITGSYGKTTTKDLLHQALSFQGMTSKTTSNNNGINGMAAAIASLGADHRFCVIEIATTKPGVLQYTAPHCDADIGIVTTVSNAHLGNFESRTAIWDDKVAVLQAMRGGLPAIVGRPVVELDREGTGYLNQLGRDILIVGRQAEDDIQLLDHVLGIHDTRARIRAGSTVLDVHLPVSGDGYAVAACFVLATGYALGLPLSELADAMRGFQHPDIKRGTRYRLRLGESEFAEFIDDAQNSTPMTLKAMLNYLRMRRPARKILVMGDMLDLGEDALEQHIALAPEIRASGLDHLVAIGPLAGALAETVSGDLSVSVFTDLETAQQPLKTMLRSGDLIAVKGTGYMGLSGLRTKLVQPGRQVLIRSNWIVEDIACPQKRVGSPPKPSHPQSLH